MVTANDIFQTQIGILQKETNEVFDENDIATGILKANAFTCKDLYNSIEQKQKLHFFLEKLTLDELKIVGGLRNIVYNQGIVASGKVIISGVLSTVIPNQSELSANGNTYIVQQSAEISEYTLNLASVSRNGTIATITTTMPHNLATGLKMSISGFSEVNFNKSDVIITVTTEYSFTYEVENTGALNNTNGILFFNGAFVTIQANSIGSSLNLTNGTSLSGSISGVESIIVNYNDIKGGRDPESRLDYMTRIKNDIINPVNESTKSKIINTIIEKFPQITTGKLLNNYKQTIPIVSIMKDATLNNNYQRKITCLQPHGLRDLTSFQSIQGSNRASLNINSSVTNNRAISKIYDDFSFAINVENAVDEDNESTSMSIALQTGFTTVVLYKGNSAINTVSIQEINDIEDYLVNDIIEFTSTRKSFGIVSAISDYKTINISSLTPNLQSLKNSIRDNIFDYIKKNQKIGQVIKKTQLEFIIANTNDANGNLPEYFETNIPSLGFQPQSELHIVEILKNNINFE